MHFLKNIALMSKKYPIFFLMAFAALESCDKGDDDSGSPSGNNNGLGFEQSSYELIIEGDINDTLTGDSAIFVDTILQQDTSTALMALYMPNEATSYHFFATVAKSDTSIVDEGIYEQWSDNGPEFLTTGGGGNFSISPDTSYFGSSGTISKGYIKISSRSASKATGTIEDLKLFNPLDSVIISGKFQAKAGEPLWWD